MLALKSTDASASMALYQSGQDPSDSSACLRAKVDEERATQIVSQEDLEIRVDLGLGKESAKYWTCDFSYVSVSHVEGNMVNVC